MPIVEAHLLEGYPPEVKSRITEALTDAIRLCVPAPDEAITVMLHEYPPENYARGGKHRSPATAPPDPARIVLDYLAAMEARELDAAQAFLAPGFEMVFPGTAPMSALGDLVTWAKDRYRFVTKTTEAVEVFHGNGATVVYTRGTLAGAWPDGTAFAGIRFIDRFEIVDGRITRQDVWNDIAEVRPA
jgi:4-oxalocrotonate tautomerase family enzyme